MDQIKKRKRREKLIRQKFERRRESIRLLKKQQELEDTKREQIRKDAIKLQELEIKEVKFPSEQEAYLHDNDNIVNNNFNKEAWAIKPNTNEVKRESTQGSGFNKDAWKVKI